MHYRVDITAMLREDEYLASDWLMEVNLACHWWITESEIENPG